MTNTIRTEPIKEFTLASVNRYAAIATLLANSDEVEPAKHALVAIDIRDDAGQRCAASAGVTKPEMDAVFASSDAGHMEIKQQMIWKERNDANEEIVRDKRSFWGSMDNAGGANPWSGVGTFGIDKSGYGTTSDQELSERRRKQEEALEASKSPAQVASEATAKAMVGLQKEIANAQAALGELAKNAKDFPSGKGPDRGGNPIFPW